MIQTTNYSETQGRILFTHDEKYLGCPDFIYNATAERQKEAVVKFSPGFHPANMIARQGRVSGVYCRAVKDSDRSGHYTIYPCAKSKDERLMAAKIFLVSRQGYRTAYPLESYLKNTGARTLYYTESRGQSRRYKMPYSIGDEVFPAYWTLAKIFLRFERGAGFAAFFIRDRSEASPLEPDPYSEDGSKILLFAQAIESATMSCPAEVETARDAASFLAAQDQSELEKQYLCPFFSLDDLNSARSKTREMQRYECGYIAL